MNLWKIPLLPQIVNPVLCENWEWRKTAQTTKTVDKLYKIHLALKYITWKFYITYLLFRQTWDHFSLTCAYLELCGWRKSNVTNSLQRYPRIETKNWPMVSFLPYSPSLDTEKLRPTMHQSEGQVVSSLPLQKHRGWGKWSIITNSCRLWEPWKVYSHLLIVESILSLNWFQFD